MSGATETPRLNSGSTVCDRRDGGGDKGLLQVSVTQGWR